MRDFVTKIGIAAIDLRDALERKEFLEYQERHIKRFSEAVIQEIRNIIEQAGGDVSLMPEANTLNYDIGTAFEGAIAEQDRQEPDYSRPYSTMNKTAQGIW